MKISYAITVCNEIEEIKRLIPFLLEHKREEDEIVVQQDITELNEEVYGYLFKQDIEKNLIFRTHHLQNDFAQFKNNLTQYCSGDYIFQIDADEIPNPYLISYLHTIILMNNFDICLVPRINTVEGITQKHILKWGWRINEKGWVNYPDKQWRLYRNTPEIKWDGKVHERLIGFQTYTSLPELEEFSLYHPKTIERQEKQNELYSKI